MTVSLKHAFQSAKADGTDTSIVRPSDWNAEHVLTQATGKLLGRTSAGAGATEEITAGSGLTLGSGTLSADVTSVAGRTGAVTLGVADVSGAAPSASPTFTGKASFPASTATGANVNLGYGANVTSNLVDGDVWIETNNLRWYSNGTTWRASAVGHTHVSTAITDSTAAGRALLTGADASAQRTSLGLGSAALLNSSGVVQQSAATGAALIPVGTTAERPTAATGQFRYNTTLGAFEGYNGTSWGSIGGGGSSTTFTTETFTATAGQTSFSPTGGYTVTQIHVYRNGVKLNTSDFTATNGTTVVLSNSCAANDTIEIVKWSSVSIANAVLITGDTMTGDLTVPNVSITGNLSFNSGYGSSAVAYGCRAWVNFNGTGTVAIRSSGNVTSITDNGTGDYTVNFTNALVAANSATHVTGSASSAAAFNYSFGVTDSLAYSTTAVRVQSEKSDGTASDMPRMSVTVFR